MKTVLTIITVLGLSILAGCQGAGEEAKLLSAGRELLTVDFYKGHTLRYKFVSSREIDINWGQDKSTAQPGQGMLDKQSESTEMVVAYTPIEVDPYGLSTIEATCESVKVKRSKGPKKDAVEYLPGKTFTLKVGSTGKIEDYSQLDELIREIGKKAFRADSKQGRIKEPDLIDDFTATQRFLWDSVSSIKKPTEGLRVGQSWKSILPIPTSMVLRKARDVTYTLDEVRQSEKGRLAVISSSYSLAESYPHNWPKPYIGKFKLSGPFGFFWSFFRGFNIPDLHGQGQELFNIDAGRIEQYEHKYQMRLEASSGPLPGVEPKIFIKQTLTMQLLE